jgi:hypothetical protein
MAKPALYYDNRFADATPTASTTATGFAVANLRDWRPYTWWKPTALPATVTVDCASPKAADYALLYGHNLGTTGCTVQIRGSTDNFAASDVLVATSTPTTDAPLLIPFTGVSYRYWRLRIITGTAPSIAIAAIGTALELPTWLPQGFDPVGCEVVGSVARNANGQPLSIFGDDVLAHLDLSAAHLPIGSRLRVGDAVVAVTPKPHDGCRKFMARVGEGGLHAAGVVTACDLAVLAARACRQAGKKRRKIRA